MFVYMIYYLLQVAHNICIQMHFDIQTDVLLALRNHVTSFEDKVYLILLDGDTHTMYYRKDVLDHFGKHAFTLIYHIYASTIYDSCVAFLPLLIS